MRLKVGRIFSSCVTTMMADEAGALCVASDSNECQQERAEKHAEGLIPNGDVCFTAEVELGDEAKQAVVSENMVGVLKDDVGQTETEDDEPEGKDQAQARDANRVGG